MSIDRKEAAMIFSLANDLKKTFNEYKFIDTNGVGTLYKEIAADKYFKAENTFNDYVNSLVKKD